MPLIYGNVTLGGKRIDADKFRSALRKLVLATAPVLIRYNVVTGTLWVTPIQGGEGSPVSTLIAVHKQPGEEIETQMVLMLKFHNENMYGFPAGAKIDVKCMNQIDKLLKGTHVLLEDDGTPHEFSGVFEAVMMPKEALARS